MDVDNLRVFLPNGNVEDFKTDEDGIDRCVVSWGSPDECNTTSCTIYCQGNEIGFVGIPFSYKRKLPGVK